MNNLQALVDLLSSSQLRVSTGLWLLPTAYLGYEEDEAHRLGLEPVDLRLRLLQALPSGTRYTGLSIDRIVTLVDKVSQEYGDWAGALVYNLDLLLARLTYDERLIIWHDFLTALPHRRRGVLLTIPETAVNLLPEEDNLAIWRQENRLIGTIRDQRIEG